MDVPSMLADNGQSSATVGSSGGLRARGNLVTESGTIVATNGVDGRVSGGSGQVGVDSVDGLY
eukprot:scaffold170794_cov44-Attheya_sp.AAC.1